MVISTPSKTHNTREREREREMRDREIERLRDEIESVFNEVTVPVATSEYLDFCLSFWSC